MEHGKVRIEVVVGDRFGGHISLVEELKIQTGSMKEVSNVLQLFHDLVERIRDEQAGLKT